MQETMYTPSDDQLKSWGITREQYRSLYSKAEKDVAAASKKWYLPKILEYGVGDVNKYLKEQMVKTNGQYGLDAVSGAQKATTPVETPVETPTTVPLPSVNTAPAVGDGGGYSAGSYKAPVEELKNYTADELAKKFGIVNDYATILKELQDATTAKFDETETTMKRAESTNLRSQESAYNQYLQDLRSRSANAVASGATKGTMAANALTSLLGFQESNRESTNLMNDLLYDTAQERGKMLKQDAIDARASETAIGQYLGNLSTSMDTNEINLRAAQLAAEAQRYQAGVGASATTNAARIQANAAYEQILNAFKNDYINKNYSSQQANALAYTDYAGLIKNQYNPTK